MRDRRYLWERVFCGALVGTAPYAKNKVDVDELVVRAKMLADQAMKIAARENAGDDPSDPIVLLEEEEDAAPFPLVRHATTPCPPPIHFPPESGSFLFDGPGIRDVDELEARR
jgi:hypothetical protein